MEFFFSHKKFQNEKTPSLGIPITLGTVSSDPIMKTMCNRRFRQCVTIQVQACWGQSSAKIVRRTKPFNNLRTKSFNHFWGHKTVLPSWGRKTSHHFKGERGKEKKLRTDSRRLGPYHPLLEFRAFSWWVNKFQKILFGPPPSSYGWSTPGATSS